MPDQTADDFRCRLSLTLVTHSMRNIYKVSNKTIAKALAEASKAVESYPTGEIVVEIAEDGRMRCVNMQTSTNRVLCK